MTFEKSRIALLALGTVATLAVGIAYRDSLRKGPAKVTEAPAALDAGRAALPATVPVSLRHS